MAARNILLGQPYRIGNFSVKNRMVMSPMNTNYSDENGCLTAQMESYYIRRARGGAGLIVLEAASVSPDSRNHGVQPMLYDEKYIPHWSNLIEQLHSYGAKVSVEIAHFGSEATLEPRMSASAVTRFEPDTVKVMTKEDIFKVEEAFAKTIANAKMAGADAVTLHGAHGYLIAEFMSPLYNKRTDDYGECLENRLRFVTEIIRKAKTLVGETFPIIVRYSVNEYAVGGRTPEESVQVARILEREGAAAIDLSAGIPNAYIFTNPPNGLGDTSCMLAPYAEMVKKAVNIPVIVSNTIRTPAEAEAILEKGQADFIGLARPLLADADYCNKVLEGRNEDIRHCLSCQHCFRTLDSGRSLRCAVNPETGREYIYGNIEKVSAGKKVAVIGGGPAGMESARVAAMMGHDATLFEAGDRLGGSLIAAAIPPNKEKIAWLVSWYVRQLEKLGVTVRLNTAADAELLKKEGFEAVMLASGAEYVRRIKGSDRGSVVTAVDVLLGKVQTGKDVVIIGGGATGCETADWLCGDAVKLKFTQVDGVDGKLLFEKTVSGKPDHEVTIVEMLPDIATDMDEFNKQVMHILLPEKGAKIMADTMVEEIVPGGVYVIDRKTGEKTLLMADTVILAGGLKPRTMDLSDFESDLAGDSEKPGRIADAIFSAYARARRL
jgi:2,4-dienoyl-CoA reductase-like NADH-dependent reductase (Old Yellow Enzyme family)/pyruvate/2-oxoglutarate dehydrogenase complex dihydrolipoamide dehydrogenase (E3) component